MFRTKLNAGGSLEDLITDVIETTGYVRELEEDDDEETAKDRISNIDELVTKLVTFEIEKEKLGEEATLSAFLEEVALVADIDSVDGGDNRVLLMTIHSAKGLEFSQVYLAGLEDGVFPSYMTITSDDGDDMEEERRLAYVGLTRAKDDLTITYAKARMIRGTTQYNAVSRFVREIPGELLDNKLPSAKRWDEDDYGDDSYEKNIFRTKPFQSGGLKTDLGGTNNWTAAASYLEKINRTPTPKTISKPVNERLSDKKNPIKTNVPKNGGNSPTANSVLGGIRPKAVVRKKETPSANRPYISKSLDGLTKGAPTLTKEQLGYSIGDRVKHIKYGEGTVLNIVQEPKDFKVTVNFEAYGNKIMYAAFAKLEKI
jgi:DNA helicase-2/ATP-dependent DNA helicase PcrA